MKKPAGVKIACVLLCVLQMAVGMLSAQAPLAFKQITVENGLSSNSTLAIAQDQKGFLWAGTMDGLNRYDGRRIKIYRSFLSDNFRGTRRKINSLLVDRSNRLWVGTNNGLYLYNSTTDSFRAFFHEPSLRSGLSNDVVNCLYEDSKGRVWVATDEGLNRMEWTKDSLSFVRLPLLTKSGAAPQKILCILEARNGQLMAGTEDGIIRFGLTPDHGSVVNMQYGHAGMAVVSIAEDALHFWAGTRATGLVQLDGQLQIVKQFRQGDNGHGLLSDVVRKIHLDRKGQLWIGTLKGLNLLHTNTGEMEAYVHKPTDPHSLNFNSIYDLFEDKQGNTWIATFFGGLNYVEALATPFTIYQDGFGNKGLNSNIISSIVEDANGNLWIGTEAEGLNYFDRQQQVFKSYKNDAAHPDVLNSNLVKTVIRVDRQIWVGMHEGGVNILDEFGRKLAGFDKDNGPNSLNSRHVTCLMRDHLGRIWIGHEEQGINIYDPKTQIILDFDSAYPGMPLNNKAITCLYEDAQHNVWIGSWVGLNKLERNGLQLNPVAVSAPAAHLQADYVYCVAEDRRGQLWVGTNSGIARYNPATKKLEYYQPPAAMGDFKGLGMVADGRNNLWISSNNGLRMLDSARRQFYSFNTQDGLPGNVFNLNSYCRDSKGHLFFGGYHGLVEFDPNNMHLNSQVAPVELTELRINGTPVNAGDATGILGGSITETDEIILRYDQNVLELDYGVLNFIKSAKNRSAYMLDGYDKTWIYTTAGRVSYTNLPTGSYRLLLRSANNDGIWSSGPKVFKITVLPPPWKTWWAYSLYAMALGLLAFGIIYFFASRTAMRRRLRYEHKLLVQQQELHQMKMDFFTHISHELRTPLTLIAGPVEMLQQLLGGKPQVEKLLNSIQQNADRLIKLTNDLLAFRKADAGHTQLNKETVDFVAFTRTVYDKFTGEAARKQIDLRFMSAPPALDVPVDTHHMEIVLTNLLSNALKFTPSGGKVLLSILQPNEGRVELTVSDNGSGIAKENQEKIFTGFYQADSNSKKQVGTGIGLAFSKRLVELHGGSLSFTSDKKTGTDEIETCFRVSLPLNHSSTLPAQPSTIA
ncbi:MAG TPA: two-component regulator propeller domain-containing protein [Phnomibacter sp.]|nr:two-component regulator propeller domain-containing protein [Phnomibacter sp.]